MNTIMKVFVLMFPLVAFLTCSKTTEPVSQLTYQLEVIPASRFTPSWDTTFCQHDTTWNLNSPIFPDTIAADSFANVLTSSGLPVTDFWYPQQSSTCRIWIRSGSEVIVKLQYPDSATAQLGLQTRDGFPIPCIPDWRHYSFTRQ
jgi:hypothetical protein